MAGETAAFSGPGDAETINRVAVTDPAAYRELFRGAESFAARGDASVSTLYYSAKAAPRLKALNPDARVILVLRDPVDRAFSSHQYLRNRGFSRNRTSWRRSPRSPAGSSRVGTTCGTTRA